MLIYVYLLSTLPLILDPTAAQLRERGKRENETVCVRERESQRERESLVGTTRYRVQGKGVRGVRGARGVANVLLICC